ncbi:hypothetical protein L1987_34964 [Smallanthus sonchifolius]|uniref:Uncharacterized protein n=1 Tax=Smallanthus sonchifolius TaxID=185202 RepID=A0ACB9HVA0_9ASTR|nr:hypothetical protein L1987_34964 [Smallanthus sonchifolius]
MDTVIKKFFSDFSSNGIQFGSLDEGMVREIFLEGILTTTSDRLLVAVGAAEPEPVADAVAAGVAVAVADAGLLELQALSDSRRRAQSEDHRRHAQNLWWDVDCIAVEPHVYGPLMDMGRQSCLASCKHPSLHIDNEGGEPTAEWDEFTDGNVVIDRNQWWGKYPKENKWKLGEWPAGKSPAKLYGHFSTALHIICTLAYQFLPVTAEGQIWLSFDWTVNLPAFSSIRGLYKFLNEEEAAYVNHRALDKWSFMGNELEKLNLMALVFIQAVQTGMAIRSLRCGLEQDPTDINNSYADFYSPANLISAAAAEALKTTVPLTGMSGVYVGLQEVFDSYEPDRLIYLPEDTDIKPLKGIYDVVKGKFEAPTIRAPWTTFAGMPTLLLPLNPFTYNTPFTMKGEFTSEMGKVEPRGFRLLACTAWELVSLHKWGGYNLSGRFIGETAGQACSTAVSGFVEQIWVFGVD